MISFLFKMLNFILFFKFVSSVQKDDIGAHINVGRTYNNLKLYKQAEDAYLKVSMSFKRLCYYNSKEGLSLSKKLKKKTL